MSSSCMSSGGGGRAYRIESLDLDIIKSPSSTSWISNSPSPSSTLSESSNGPLAVATRKPRTPRKRPNQTYNEAAAILSTAYPKIFPTTKPCKFSHDHSLFEPSDLLMPFQEVDSSGFLLDSRPDFPIEIKALLNPCRSSGEITCVEEEEEEEEEFDAESILDEEMGEGIESIMGNLEMETQPFQPPINTASTFCYGYPVGLGLDSGYGMIRESRAMRHVDQCDWWSFPSVNVIDVNPNLAKVSGEKKKKMKLESINSLSVTNSPAQDSVPQPNAGLLLKLNYDSILHDWSDKASPFSGDSPAAESAGNDVRARLAQIDLFWDNGGVREASVLRYKEKRRTRLFSKKIRYEVRKVNADRRPRMKGRFVRTPNSSDD